MAYERQHVSTETGPTSAAKQVSYNHRGFPAAEQAVPSVQNRLEQLGDSPSYSYSKLRSSKKTTCRVNLKI